ncbi:MAG: hypothetical protein JO263_00380 [Candidatus Eremiobacteraeota bacterium]|nr:hypothetical protein [Candidatus Eremiobacteraeota bacterium]
MKRIVLCLATALLLGGCTSQNSPIAIVDVTRITANWPKFINYQNQLQADAAAIARSNIPEQEKERKSAALRQQFVAEQNEVTQDVRDAVSKIAADRHFNLVVTRESTGFGGVDITPDVEKLLNITEHSAPPSS